MVGESGRTVFQKSFKLPMEGSVYIILNILDSLPVQYPVHFFQHHTELRLFICSEKSRYS